MILPNFYSYVVFMTNAEKGTSLSRCHLVRACQKEETVEKVFAKVS